MKKTILVAFVFLIAQPNCSFGQLPFDSPVREQPRRDDAVMKADFQQDFRPLATAGASDDLNLDVDTFQSNEIADTGETEGGSMGQPIRSLLNDLSAQTGGVQFSKVLSSLAIVLGGYLGFVWLTRKMGGGGHNGLPSEVVEVLGHAPFGQRKQLQLVRLGSKLLLLLNNQDGSTQTIGEITDPHEVDYLSSVCGNKNNSRSAIAIRKATTSADRNDAGGGELKRVLRQLQQSGEPNRAGSVFDA